MTEVKSPADAEFVAMQAVFAALEPLESEARTRVISYIMARLGVVDLRTVSPLGGLRALSGGEGESTADEQNKSNTSYNSLAELFDVARPKSNADRVLIAGYWLQVCQGAESFDSQSANKELKHLGEGIVNITKALDSLKNQKPALALQLKKSGKSQQARKTYKVTVAGVKTVHDMIKVL